MAILVLFLRRNLCESFAQHRNIKNGIITKSSIPPRRLQDFSIHPPSNNRLRPSPLCQRNRANKMRSPLRPALPSQTLQQLTFPLRPPPPAPAAPPPQPPLPPPH